MKGNTENARNAAKEIVGLESTDNRDVLKREIVSEGIYHAVVEGGHHSCVLDDQEADFLARQLVTGGIDQLEKYAKGEIA